MCFGALQSGLLVKVKLSLVFFFSFNPFHVKQMGGWVEQKWVLIDIGEGFSFNSFFKLVTQGLLSKFPS